MKYSTMMICILGVSAAISSTAFSEETLSEKAGVTADGAKRGVKKGYNRTKEAVCGQLTGDSKMECLAKKSKNRMDEGADVVKDKGSEIKNKVD
jgi:hypothetical protein